MRRIDTGARALRATPYARIQQPAQPRQTAGSASRCFNTRRTTQAQSQQTGERGKITRYAIAALAVCAVAHLPGVGENDHKWFTPAVSTAIVAAEVAAIAVLRKVGEPETDVAATLIEKLAG